MREKKNLLSLRGGPLVESGQAAHDTRGLPITLFFARSTTETFFILLSAQSYEYQLGTLTYGISGTMASDKIDVEGQDVSGLHLLEFGDVIFVLITAAEVDVALVVCAGRA